MLPACVGQVFQRANLKTIISTAIQPGNEEIVCFRRNVSRISVIATCAGVVFSTPLKQLWLQDENSSLEDSIPQSGCRSVSEDHREAATFAGKLCFHCGHINIGAAHFQLFCVWRIQDQNIFGGVLGGYHLNIVQCSVADQWGLSMNTLTKSTTLV